MNILILGIGNVLWADEGFGVRVIECLQKHYRFPEQVKILDGGTQGVYLIEHVQEADILIVFDAIDYGLPPGTLKCIENDDVPNYMGSKKMSLHQTGFSEVLAMAQMLGRYPKRLLLIGVQPEELEDYGGSLRPKVKAKIQMAIDITLSFLQIYGVFPEIIEPACDLSDPVLNMQRYEQERPEAHEACRMGDERILQTGAFAPNRHGASAGRLPHPNPLPKGEGHSNGRSLKVDVDYRGQY